MFLNCVLFEMLRYRCIETFYGNLRVPNVSETIKQNQKQNNKKN